MNGELSIEVKSVSLTEKYHYHKRKDVDTYDSHLICVLCGAGA